MGNESLSALEKASTGVPLSVVDKLTLKQQMDDLDAESKKTDPADPDKLTQVNKWIRNHGGAMWPGVRINEMRLDRDKAQATLDKYVPPFSSQYQDAVSYMKTHPDANAFNISVSPDGHVNIGEFTTTPPFQTPNPWATVKKDAAQSVTREIRRETGKQMGRLINPDYSHNELLQQYALVRQALPEGTATRQALDKTDGAIKIALATAGITAEAANLLVNAIRGALLEAPDIKYKVAALLPDDVVRQGYVAAVRTTGNTLLAFIHDKYHLPDRPKQTPILVNTLDQLKPEHYRAQDAQKVGVDMRDLNREKAKEFILQNVPVEKQANALETIDRLPGNTFGVQIMDAGWVRISASAREPRTYDNRPRYGSYDARKSAS